MQKIDGLLTKVRMRGQRGGETRHNVQVRKLENRNRSQRSGLTNRELVTFSLRLIAVPT